MKRESRRGGGEGEAAAAVGRIAPVWPPVSLYVFARVVEGKEPVSRFRASVARPLRRGSLHRWLSGEGGRWRESDRLHEYIALSRVATAAYKRTSASGKKEKKLTKIFPPAARFFCARGRSRIFPEPSRRVAGVPAPSIARPGVLGVSLGRSVLAQASRPRSVISLRTALLKPSWYLTQIRFSFRCMTPCGASIGAFAPASAPASTSALAGRSLCSWA